MVVERPSGLVVGGVSFFGPPDDRRVEIGYGVVASRQGRGYATEAVVGMTQAVGRQPGVDRVVATVEPGNAASVRVLEEAGMTLVSRAESELTYQVTVRR